MRSNELVMLLAVIILAFVTAQAFSQEAITGSEEPMITSEEMMIEEPEEEFVTEEWLLGDVVAVDLEGSSLSVSYMDNTTEEEKEISILVDAATQYENAGFLDEIAVGNVVAIDYLLEPGGNAVALNIRVEEQEADSAE
ncbi:DUF5666 domain-containing protein [Candidatus Omnitrophota bacterium]